ncbi:MAG: sigma-70 family RNA polymerase sigma factor [Kiritimatiellae bacterium]|nr:sigma-70 family RNA polymerase sigma factor [Kiritimatiellia bacterium]
MRSDEELMRGIRDGDEGAFQEFHRRHKGLVTGRILGMVRDEAVAKDLAQEVFLRVWQRAGQWKGKGKAKGWVLRIATNLTLNHLRLVRRLREQPLEPLPDPLDEDEEPDVPSWMIDASAVGPDAVLQQMEERDLLKKRIDALSEEKREVLRLVHEAEMDVDEVAETLGIPKGTVKSRMHYGMKQLARGSGRQTDQQES